MTSFVTIEWETRCFECDTVQTETDFADENIPHSPPPRDRCPDCSADLNRYNSLQEYTVTEVVEVEA